jgi:hypothetical protein
MDIAHLNLGVRCNKDVKFPRRTRNKQVPRHVPTCHRRFPGLEAVSVDGVIPSFPLRSCAVGASEVPADDGDGRQHAVSGEKRAGRRSTAIRR